MLSRTLKPAKGSEEATLDLQTSKNVEFRGSSDTNHGNVGEEPEDIGQIQVLTDANGHSKLAKGKIGAGRKTRIDETRHFRAQTTMNLTNGVV